MKRSATVVRQYDTDDWSFYLDLKSDQESVSHCGLITPEALYTESSFSDRGVDTGCVHADKNISLDNAVRDDIMMSVNLSLTVFVRAREDGASAISRFNSPSHPRGVDLQISPGTTGDTPLSQIRRALPASRRPSFQRRILAVSRGDRPLKNGQTVLPGSLVEEEFLNRYLCATGHLNRLACGEGGSLGAYNRVTAADDVFTDGHGYAAGISSPESPPELKSL